jgi:hypothetical protein
MGTAAFFAWMGTVLAGLVLLVIWLMEYDRDYQTVAATRLPVPVLSLHALLGIVGLFVWGLYLLTDEDPLAWATVGGLGVSTVLGVTMAARWVGVYRAYAAPASVPTRLSAVPPERHFPRPVIVIHGLFATATIFLVVLTVFFTSS